MSNDNIDKLIHKITEAKNKLTENQKLDKSQFLKEHLKHLIMDLYTAVEDKNVNTIVPVEEADIEQSVEENEEELTSIPENNAQESNDDEYDHSDKEVETILNDVEEAVNENPTETSIASSISKDKDLRDIIDINRKFVFVSELFNGNNELYEKTINELNTMDSFNLAENYINNTLHNPLKWDEKDKLPKLFKSFIATKFGVELT